MKEFTSKIDTWLLGVIVAVILVSVVTVFLVMKKGGTIGYLSAIFMAVVGAALPVWLLLSTKYIVTGEALIIRSGPFSQSVLLASISSVQNTRSPRSSPALSLDRLRISYANGKSIMVSPKNKRKFRAAIGYPEG